MKKKRKHPIYIPNSELRVKGYFAYINSDAIKERNKLDDQRKKAMLNSK